MRAVAATMLAVAAMTLAAAAPWGVAGSELPPCHCVNGTHRADVVCVWAGRMQQSKPDDNVSVLTTS